MKPDKFNTLPDGRRVVARRDARLKVPGFTEPRETSVIQECRLADDQVVYLCTHPNLADGEVCAYVADTPERVRGHQKIHGKAATVRRTREVAERALAERDEALRRLAESTSRTGPTGSGGGGGDVAVSGVLTELNRLASVIDELAGELLDVVRDVENARDRVAQLTVTNPEVAEKAARYDALRSALV